MLVIAANDNGPGRISAPEPIAINFLNYDCEGNVMLAECYMAFANKEDKYVSLPA